jgi:hypothetical protein
MSKAFSFVRCPMRLSNPEQAGAASPQMLDLGGIPAPDFAQHVYGLYHLPQWLTMRRWLEANPDDEFAKDVRAKLTAEPECYAAYTREYLGWGVFALMPR